MRALAFAATGEVEQNRVGPGDLRRQVRSLSQNPLGFSGLAGIKVRGGVAPSSARAPATDEVPLRCIPSTT